MRILIVYRHFWPDTPPYASMLRTIAGHLAAQGHAVTLWAEAPCYTVAAAAAPAPRRETLDGIGVERFARLPLWHRSGLVRTLAKIVFPLRVLVRAAARRLAGRRYDLVMTATIPPVINGAAGALAARLLGARFVYHFQDIYPELGAVSGLWPERGPLHRLMAAIERRTARRMTRAVVLGEDMAATLCARGVPEAKIAVINNFMLERFPAPGEGQASCLHDAEDEINPSRARDAEGDPDLSRARDAAQEAAGDARPPGPGAPFRVIFAGNLGRFQGLEAVVDAAALLGDLPGLEVVFLGEGAALAGLKAQAAPLGHVRFLAQRPFAAAAPVIAAADLGIVSLNPGIYRAAYPSKTLTYLGLGLPVLAVIEPESALAAMIRDEDIGVVACGRDGAAIAKAVRAAYARQSGDGDGGAARRARARAVYERRFSRTAALGRWTRLVDGIGEAGDGV